MTRSIRLFVTLASLLVPTCRADAMNAIIERWRQPSRLTPLEAVRVLELDARGAVVRMEDLFEAEKHLRTDGSVSPGEYVLTELYGRLLRRELGLTSDDPSLRVEPPILHWVESRSSNGGLELRGESVQLAVQRVSSNRSIVQLRERTIEESWNHCGGELCVTATRAAYPMVRRYVWAAVRDSRSRPRSVAPRCEPSVSPRKDLDLFIDALGLADSFAREIARDDTARTACVFDDRSVGAVRLSYLTQGTLATPPMRAAAGALVNNPTEVRVFD
jgi:hypothetical protein